MSITLDQRPLYEVKAGLFKGLSHPLRIRILELLSTATERSVAELQAETGLEASHLSQHLAVLRRHRLVESDRRGSHVYYRLAYPEVAELLTVARRLLRARRDRGRRTRRRMPRLCPRSVRARDPGGRVRPRASAHRPDYRSIGRTWRGDLLAGLTVGIVALPLALGFGIASGAGAAGRARSPRSSPESSLPCSAARTSRCRGRPARWSSCSRRSWPRTAWPRWPS